MSPSTYYGWRSQDAKFAEWADAYLNAYRRAALAETSLWLGTRGIELLIQDAQGESPHVRKQAIGAIEKLIKSLAPGPSVPDGPAKPAAHDEELPEPDDELEQEFRDATSREPWKVHSTAEAG